MSRRDVEKAVAIYAEIAETMTGSGRAMQYLRIANIFAGENDADQAEKWLVKMLDCGGSEPQILSAAADFYSGQGAHAKALDFIRRAAEASPDAQAKVQYRFRLASLLEQTGRLDEAEGMLRQIVTDAPSREIADQAKGLFIDFCRRTGKLDKITIEEKK
jgi:tetratricopeptide (TPR) repeat protein